MKHTTCTMQYSHTTDTNKRYFCQVRTMLVHQQVTTANVLLVC